MTPRPACIQAGYGLVQFTCGGGAIHQGPGAPTGSSLAVDSPPPLLLGPLVPVSNHSRSVHVRPSI